jgi:hypothetical protein
MFSTVQSEDSRFLRAWKVGESTLFPLAIPKHLSREELRIRVAPTPERLTRLAYLLAESERTPVKLEVWQYKLDAVTGKLVAKQRGEASGTPTADERTP